MRTIILPVEWRITTSLSMAALARSLGIGGKNPSRSYQRYETGEQSPPLALVEKVRLMSGGRVTTASWIRARELYLESHPATRHGEAA